VKEQVDKYFSEVKIGGSDSYFHLFTANYSFDEIEKMDLKAFTENYPNCIKGNEFEEEIIKGLQILKDMDFTRLWKEYCLPFLQKHCDKYNAAIKSEHELVSSVLSDIQKLKPNKKIEDINIYMSYFTHPVHIGLASNRYLTNREEGGEINIGNILGMFVHELTHGFANQKIREIYEKAREEDELLKKSKILMYKWGQTGDEEEFVCALSNYICFRNGLTTKDAIHGKYDGGMPVAAIITDELFKLGEIPEDVNSWIYELFVNGTIKTGEVSNKLKSIFPDYVDNF
jgi:nitrogen regulatory protein PII